MLEILFGLMLLLLGWLCFGQVSLVRARHSDERARVERPPMLVRTALGVLLLLGGLALLALAGFERLCTTGW